jgi:hypothetical protein
VFRFGPASVWLYRSPSGNQLIRQCLRFVYPPRSPGKSIHEDADAARAASEGE